jgi:hypothetical protein
MTSEDAGRWFIGDQYAPGVKPGGRILTRRWPLDDERASELLAPRDDLILENEPDAAAPDLPPDADERAAADDGTTRFTQQHGPFASYLRTVEIDRDEYVERTTYHLLIPWFGWLFRVT